MDTESYTLFKLLFHKAPRLGKAALSHTLGLSKQSNKWDLTTTIIISFIRSFVIDSPPQSISKAQNTSLKDLGIKGRIWISKVTLPAPEEDDIRQALFRAIEGLKEPGEAEGGFKEPEMLAVTGEWTGYRAGVAKTAPDLKNSAEEKYKEMMREVKSPVTVLYFHGGAYYLMDPSTHRPTCKKLAKITKGRCFSVRYRLAPQNAFPTQILDALIAYFSLLYPPLGSFHEAVKPEHIVFAGDSAGGNLCLALLQTLLEFRRQGLKPRWNGLEREAPLPAGVATTSAWLDVTHSSPSCEANKDFDYLPSQSTIPQGGLTYPPCTIWPAFPPRATLYANDALLTHPLVSPLTAKSWAGSSPLYMQTGQELLSDEDAWTSQKAASQKVIVVYEEYEAMPHCFGMVLVGLPGSKRFFDGWAGFIRGVVEDKGSVVGKGTRILAKSLKEEAVDVRALRGFTDEEVLGRMRNRVEWLSRKQLNAMPKL